MILRRAHSTRILYAMAAGLAVALIAALVVTYPAIFLGWLVAGFVTLAVFCALCAGGQP